MQFFPVLAVVHPDIPDLGFVIRSLKNGDAQGEYSICPVDVAAVPEDADYFITTGGVTNAQGRLAMVVTSCCCRQLMMNSRYKQLSGTL